MFVNLEMRSRHEIDTEALELIVELRVKYCISASAPGCIASLSCSIEQFPSIILQDRRLDKNQIAMFQDLVKPHSLRSRLAFTAEQQFAFAMHAITLEASSGFNIFWPRRLPQCQAT